jgi:hypothetical protein
MNDETLKLKLSISRDLHSVFVRNLFGKRKFDDAAFLNSRSFDDRSSSLELSQSNDSTSFLSPSSTGPSSMNLSGKTCMNLPLSVFEFCLLCDTPKDTSSIIPESLQRSSSNLNGKPRSSALPVRNPVYSPLEEGSEERGSESPSPLLSSGLSRPISFRSYFPIHIQKGSAFAPSSSSSSTSSSQKITTKELFDRIGMIKLEPTRSRSYSDDEGVDSLKSKSGTGIPQQPSSSSSHGKVEETGVVGNDSQRQNGWDTSLMSSLSTPTLPPDTENVSPTPPLSRVISIEASGQAAGGIGGRGGNDDVVTAALLLLQGKSSSSSSSFTDGKPSIPSPLENKTHLKSESKSSGSDDNNDIFSSHPPLPPPSLLASNSVGNSRPSSRRFFPTTTFDSKSHPLIAVRNPKIEKMIHEANNRSNSRSNSPVLLARIGRSHSSTAEESNSFHSSRSSQSSGGNHVYGSTSSSRLNNNRLTKEDLRQYRKVLGRRMKKLLVSKKKSNKAVPMKLDSPL